MAQRKRCTKQETRSRSSRPRRRAMAAGDGDGNGRRGEPVYSCVDARMCVLVVNSLHHFLAAWLLHPEARALPCIPFRPRKLANWTPDSG
jgi:hypothetical protein